LGSSDHEEQEDVHQMTIDLWNKCNT
jgi:hypothetical protein